MITNNLLQHYKGYEQLIKDLDNALNSYERYPHAIALPFLSMDNLATAISFLGNRAQYSLFGGYENAINKRIVLGENLNQEDYICCLRATYNKKFNTLEHKDLQGAIYSLGIDFNRFGDSWINEEDIYVYVCKEVTDYVISNLTEIKHCKVSFQQCEFAFQEFHFEASKAIVSSLRLDKVVAAIVHKSREKAQIIIKNQMVKVNYKTIEDCSLICNNNDILSIRHYGRFIVDKIDKNKNGNYILIIKKFV